MFNQICQRLDSLGLREELNSHPEFRARTIPDLAPFADHVEVGPPVLAEF